MVTIYEWKNFFHSSLQIMGTFIYHGSSIFWRNVKDYASLHGNEVVCWKFLVILYRILQDGQANAVRDSLEQLEFIGQFDFFLLHCHFSFNSEVKMFVFFQIKCRSIIETHVQSWPRTAGSPGRWDGWSWRNCFSSKNIRKFPETWFSKKIHWQGYFYICFDFWYRES